MLEVGSISIPLDAFLPEGGQAVVPFVAAALGVSPGQIESCTLARRSVDARRKRDVHIVASFHVALRDARLEGKALKGKGLPCTVKPFAPYKELAVPRIPRRTPDGAPRPVVVGTGPAGLFAAWYLAKAGLAPLVLERGSTVGKRVAQVDAFNKGAELDIQTNIQFGEGGAGTFSDGKLTTNTKNPYCAHVLHWFVEAGAPPQILTDAKPHMGTDKLVGVVTSIRESICAEGGEFLFETLASGFRFERGALCAVEVTDLASGKVRELPATRLVLATGHSARDTFSALLDAQLRLEQKPFSMGVRIEHRQEDIDRAQYGAAAGHPALGAADYKLAVHLPSGRSVYTFCMCPGGEVVCAASEEEAVVVNGMSRFARDGANANSALLVNVGPADFGSAHELAGMWLQREVERAAYKAATAAGGSPYQAPAQTVGDFLAKTSGRPASSVSPSYARGVAWCDLRSCLPGFIADALAEALPLFDAKLHGFADSQAVLTGVETRSSSPVRVCRGRDFQAFLDGGEGAAGRPGATAGPGGGAAAGSAAEEGGSGLYPCGEGAGYAGGIMSAAVDGLRVAEALVCQLAGDAGGAAR